jgi:hypothetical protein
MLVPEQWAQWLRPEWLPLLTAARGKRPNIGNNRKTRQPDTSKEPG